LNGTGRFGTTNGVFRSVDAVAVLRAVEQIIECKCPVPVPKGGETRFNTLGGTLTAKNGVIRNEDLVLSGDGFTITGKGMLANLHNNTLKYNLKLGVSEARKGADGGDYNLGGYSVPIKCRGAIESPTCLPDFGDIIKQVAKSAITKEIGKKLQDAIGGDAGEVLKRIFKF
ncbi:MAG: AsmA-like C-terminal region-containing protein, partial [Gammaproteobacteria bacterium]